MHQWGCLTNGWKEVPYFQINCARRFECSKRVLVTECPASVDGWAAQKLRLHLVAENPWFQQASGENRSGNQVKKKNSMCFHKILWITISTIWYTGRSIDSSIDRSIDGSNLPVDCRMGSIHAASTWAEAKLSASQPKCWKATGRKLGPDDDPLMMISYCWLHMEVS